MNMRLPAEWERQSGVMLTWPDETTPWYELEKVQECYGRIISAILRFEKVLLVTADIEAATVRLNEIGVDTSKIQFQECPINDTWARDHGGIAVYGDNGEKYLYDFVFNGWGLKFASNFDNGITKKIFFDRAFADEVMCVDMRPFVLEGGSIDTDGPAPLWPPRNAFAATTGMNISPKRKSRVSSSRRSASSVCSGWTAAASPATTRTATSTFWRVSATLRRSPT